MQDDDSHRGAARWIIAGGIAGVTLVALVGLLWEPIRLAWYTRKLQSPVSRTRADAAEKVLGFGLRGRKALLAAMDSRDNEVAASIHARLETALQADLAAGRDVSRIIRAALDRMKNPDPYGRRCAGIASVAWNTALVDEQTKCKILQRCIQFEILARPEYPRGKGRPSLRVTHHRTAYMNGIRTRHLAVNGQWAKPSGGAFGGRGWQIMEPIRNATEQSGEYKITARLEFEAGIVPEGTAPAETQPPANSAKIVLEAEPVSYIVRDDLPTDYLQTKVTPELARQMPKALDTIRHQESAHSFTYYGMRVEFESDRLSASFSRTLPLKLDGPRPIDLAFKTVWHVPDKEKTIEGQTGVIRKSDVEKRIRLSGDALSYIVNEALIDAMRKRSDTGTCTLRIKPVLEPSLEAALDDPDIESYWPLAVELPEFMLKVKITRPKKE